MNTLAVLSLLIWLYLLLAHGRFWHPGRNWPPSRPDCPAAGRRGRSGARRGAADRAKRCARCWRRTTPGRFRVILVDDGSTDGTGAIARGIGDPRLTVVEGQPRPAGWSGKLWAVAQGLDAADDDRFACC